MSEESVESRLGRIEATLEGMEKLLTSHFKKEEMDFEKMNERLRSLERWKSYTMGAAAVVGGGITLIWKKLGG